MIEEINVDLINHSKSITNGVKSVFSNAIVNVYTNYFQILNLPVNVINGYLRKVGEEIANRDSILHGLAKVYNYIRSDGTSGKSVQLFEEF